MLGATNQLGNLGVYIYESILDAYIVAMNLFQCHFSDSRNRWFTESLHYTEPQKGQDSLPTTIFRGELLVLGSAYTYY